MTRKSNNIMKIKTIFFSAFLFIAIFTLCFVQPQDISDIIKQADENIAKYRQGDASLQFTDDNGNPVRSPEIRVEQVSQDFLFGNIILPVVGLLGEFEFSDENLSNGLSLYNEGECWDGYTLVPYEEGMILIIDMEGNIVHHWNFGTERARLLENGNIVIMQGRKIIEYDWDGNIVWDYEVPGGPYSDESYPSPGVIHHDLQRLPNGNTIFIVHEVVPEEFKEKIKNPARRSSRIIGDRFIEVNKDKEIVWEWHAHQGLDLNEDAIFHPAEGEKYDWTHSNTVDVLPENRWYDKGYEEFKPGNVIICSRQLDEIYIIDRESKKVVWKYRGEYMAGLSRAHEPFMIEKGLPGAGNILIYDNGTDRHTNVAEGERVIEDMTVVLEINPVTKRIVWLYQDKKFYSAIQGTQQRLPNGNTFICESTQGRLFEITDKGKIVWEYIMPPFPGSDAEHGFGSRPHRYAYDYCPQLERISKKN